MRRPRCQIEKIDPNELRQALKPFTSIELLIELEKRGIGVVWRVWDKRKQGKINVVFDVVERTITIPDHRRSKTATAGSDRSGHH